MIKTPLKFLGLAAFAVFLAQGDLFAKATKKSNADKACDCSCEETKKTDGQAAEPKTGSKTQTMPEVVMYSKDGCNFCVMAKKSLSRRGVKVVEKDVADPVILKELRAKVPNARSVPQIFIGGEHIGGYGEFNVLDQDGQINKMLGFKPE